MLTSADVLARTLRDAGVTRMFGLPGGEILDFVDAARRAGIAFLLTRHEATASLMADVTGQISRQPGVCVSTLGPGAVNMTLGVANAYLDRSPLIAITASHALAAAPYATHQKLDLNAVYQPMTKAAFTLDGIDTAAKVRRAIDSASNRGWGRCTSRCRATSRGARSARRWSRATTS
jgi:acetolactate synthase I/II/III large subunit